MRTRRSRRPLLGEVTFAGGAAVGRGLLLEDPVSHQGLQPGAENVFRQPQAGLELAEPFLALKRVADNQRGPRVADLIQ
jgi:hypothetical protein